MRREQGKQNQAKTTGVIIALVVIVAGLGFFGAYGNLRTRENVLASRAIDIDKREKQLDQRAQDQELQTSTLKERDAAIIKLDEAAKERAESLDLRQTSLETREKNLRDQEAKVARRYTVLKASERNCESLVRAFKQREFSLTNAAESSQRIASLANRIEAVAQSRPTAEWEIKTREVALRKLLEAREHLVLRGSVDSYSASAEVDWQRELLQEFAARLELTKPVLADNLYRILDRATLDDLEVRWSAKRDQIQTIAASAPAGAMKDALEAAEAKLTELRVAKQGAQLDLSIEFGKAILSRGIKPELETWLETQERARDGEIHRREQQLLEKALAIDRSDLAAYLRREELADSRTSDSVLGRVFLEREILLLERAHASRPVPSQSKDAVELFKKRFTDPLRAVEIEAVLRAQWFETPGQFSSSFEDWMASNLAEEDLFEVKLYLDEARTRLLLFESQSPQEVHARAKVDQQAVAKEYEAIEREITYRQEHAKPRRNIDLGQINFLAKYAISQPSEILKTPKGRQAHWEALRLYTTRTLPDSEADRVKIELEFAGLKDEVAGFEKDAQRIRSWSSTFESYGGQTSLIKEFPLLAAQNDQRGMRIDNALARLATQVNEPDAVAQLRIRIKNGLIGIPPPTDDLAIAYGDAKGVELSRTVESSLSTLDPTLNEQRQSWESRQAEKRRWEAELAAERDREYERLQAMRVEQSYLNELRRTYPAARLVGTTASGEKIYKLGPQGGLIGNKNYVDESGVRYELLDNGVL